MTNPASPAGEPLRIVFAGTPEFARAHLAAILDSRHPVIAVYTQPDRAAGRGKKLSPSPVKALAIERGLTLMQPASLKDPAEQARLADLGADLMVVVAYGLLLPQAVLDTPRLGCINVHASLLPRWRGAAPIERAIEAGDARTGLTIMQMDAGLDTGAMLSSWSCPIDEDTTGDSLRATLAANGGPALLEALERISRGALRPEAQDDRLSTYAPKLGRAEARIDWRQDAEFIARRVRAFCSANVTHSTLADQPIRIWQARAEPREHDVAPGTILGAGKNGIEVACGNGILRITSLQLPGRKVLDVAAVLNARRDLFKVGARFGHHD